LAANTHTAILAFQFGPLSSAEVAVKLAERRPNLSVYARDGAVIFGVPGKWQPGKPPTEEWESIRRTFWRYASEKSPEEFLLGDFAKLARFFALAQATEFVARQTVVNEADEQEEGNSVSEAGANNEAEANE